MTKSESKKYPQNLQQNKPSGSSNKKKRIKKRTESKKFEEYIDIDKVNEGLANGILIKGFVRINPKNFKDSYVSNENTSLVDYYLTSVIDRNRALEGDEVVLRVKTEKIGLMERKPQKLYISPRCDFSFYPYKEVHPRISVGTLKPSEGSKNYALFYPRDKRIPILRIPTATWPLGFTTDPKSYEKKLFIAKILEWQVPEFAVGMLIEDLGIAGNLNVEIMSILREFCLDVTPFTPEMLQCLPNLDISQKEYEYREDIRTQCVFSIDPITARDLDDAVSVKQLPNGNYEIGVHISDVSHYLEEDLCLHCSLLPGKDKLSFSVFWEMTENAEIVSTRFTRSVVNSCAQLAYEHAQKIIENPTIDNDDIGLPQIHNGFTANDIKEAVIILQNIAVKLRDRRIENGALKIDQVKLSFSLDSNTGEPIDFCKYENKESHRLIEEFMLLANISVAVRICEMYPDIAFLRCHEPPKQTMLVDLKNSLATCGIHIDISSSSGINTSLKKYITDDFSGQCRAAVLNHITAKAMTRARYFCASTVESEPDYKHYALSIPIYTHFTSPIRRYADIMVHRLLAATLDYREKPEWNVDYVTAIAANCNAQKYNAKRAGEASSDLYLAHYVEKNQPFEESCVVVDVKDKSFDAIVLKTGSLVRIYQNSCEKGTIWEVTSTSIKMSSDDENSLENGAVKRKPEFDKKMFRLTITFPQTDHHPMSRIIIEMFSTVKVNLERKNCYKLEAKLLRPVTTQIFTQQ
ncbi:hypothetical protein NQ317_001612 [Molorchus minor]|uniref:RNB domain-containing protein n=1 Tax=Molorchus minor TaxID=1323400 RepID=A0ABQ9JS82_9CUCU|nr:hypothetical protein NQ317_001612 [Molorchus minor]